MGYALARLAAEKGSRVILVSGPTSLPVPDGVSIVRVSTAVEMKEQVMKHFKEADVVISSAAVADYRPEDTSSSKLKSGKKKLSINLEKNPDILKELGKKKGRKI